MLHSYFTRLPLAYPGTMRDDKKDDEKDLISRFERREARKRLQQEVDRQQQALEGFLAYFNAEHNYAAKESDSLSPSPKRVKCDPLYIPLSQEKGMWLEVELERPFQHVIVSYSCLISRMSN